MKLRSENPKNKLRSPAAASPSPAAVVVVQETKKRTPLKPFQLRIQPVSTGGPKNPRTVNNNNKTKPRRKYKRISKHTKFTNENEENQVPQNGSSMRGNRSLPKVLVRLRPMTTDVMEILLPRRKVVIHLQRDEKANEMLLNEGAGSGDDNEHVNGGDGEVNGQSFDDLFSGLDFEADFQDAEINVDELERSFFGF